MADLAIPPDPGWGPGDTLMCVHDKPGSNREHFDTPGGIVFKGWTYKVERMECIVMAGTPVWRVHLVGLPVIYIPHGYPVGWQIARFKKIT